MSATRFDETIRAELTQLEGPFGPLRIDTAANGDLRIEARVRGLRVRLEIDPLEYPTLPPALFVAQRRVWHPVVGEGGRITDLRSLGEWNRTLGLASVLQELQILFTDEPPLVRGDLTEQARRLLARLWS